MDRRSVGDGAFDELEAGVVAVGLEVIETAGGQIVQGCDVVAALQELLRQVRTDESRTSCDEDPHAFPPCRISAPNIQRRLHWTGAWERWRLISTQARRLWNGTGTVNE